MSRKELNMDFSEEMNNGISSPEELEEHRKEEGEIDDESVQTVTGGSWIRRKQNPAPAPQKTPLS